MKQQAVFELECGKMWVFWE